MDFGKEMGLNKTTNYANMNKIYLFFPTSSLLPSLRLAKRLCTWLPFPPWTFSWPTFSFLRQPFIALLRHAFVAFLGLVSVISQTFCRCPGCVSEVIGEVALFFLGFVECFRSILREVIIVVDGADPALLLFAFFHSGLEESHLLGFKLVCYRIVHFSH